MATGNNIQRFREQRGWSRPQLGARMGTSGQQVERLEKGMRKLSHEWIERSAEALGVQATDIIAQTPQVILQPDQKRAAAGHGGATQEQPRVSTIGAGETAGVLKLDLSAAMGPGRSIETFVESDVVAFDLSMLNSITRTPSDRLRLITGIGTSHEPKFQSGDQFLIDINERSLTRIDGYYWITFDDAYGLKRLRPAGGGRTWIMSDNKEDYPPFDVDARELRIEGRAIWFARGL